MELNLPGFNALLGLVHIFESGPDTLFKTRNRGPNNGRYIIRWVLQYGKCNMSFHNKWGCGNRG